MSPRELSDATPVPLKWLSAVCLAAFAAGGGYAVGQSRTSSVEQRMTAAEKRIEEHSESLHDKDKRLALVERAVVALETMARGKP